MEEEKKKEILEEKVVEATEIKQPKKNNKMPLIVAAVAVIIIVLVAVIVVTIKSSKKEEVKKVDNDKVEYTEYTMKGNSLDTFDLAFLKLENEEKNKVYSPLSIKYALSMLSTATEGESNKQLKSLIGDYKYKKYTNSENLSLANSLFVRDRFKDNVKQSYVDKLKSKYNAEVVYDSFESPDNINKWVSDKTFNLVDNILDDVSDSEFVMVNALAIDMEWVNTIKPKKETYYVSFKNERFYESVYSYEENGYDTLLFNDSKNQSSAARVAAIANRYDIVNVLGEDTIRKEVGNEYSKWLNEEPCAKDSKQPSVDEYLDQYIKDIDSNYKHLSSSTDFYFYENDDVKVFAKDLKEYDGNTLEYIGIMPTKENLKDYIEKLDSKTVVDLIGSLKEIKLESFNDGVVTRVVGTIPMFNFEYKLNFKEDLQKLGVKDVFKVPEANLKGLTDEKDMYINDAQHKAKIEFTNDGIKAGAATSVGGGYGAAGCYFTHLYDVPVEEIDLTFDKPYLFFIIDKATGEVWFTGTVYEPSTYERPKYSWE